MKNVQFISSKEPLKPVTSMKPENWYVGIRSDKTIHCYVYCSSEYFATFISGTTGPAIRPLDKMDSFIIGIQCTLYECPSLRLHIISDAM